MAAPNQATAHVDTFARDRLPPPDTWPVFRFNDDTRYPDRLNAAVELVDRHVAAGNGARVAVRRRCSLAERGR